jgi:hypothetical protein
MFLLTVKKDTFTDLVFWMMNASKSTSTTTPMITLTHVPESRVRPVGFRGAGFARSGLLGTSGRGVGLSDAGNSLLMRWTAFFFGREPTVESNPIFLVRPEPPAGAKVLIVLSTAQSKRTDDSGTSGSCPCADAEGHLLCAGPTEDRRQCLGRTDRRLGRSPLSCLRRT